jgi:hypothetical protein
LGAALCRHWHLGAAVIAEKTGFLAHIPTRTITAQRTGPKDAGRHFYARSAAGC